MENAVLPIFHRCVQVQVAFRHLLVHLVLSRIVERMFQHVHGNLRGPPTFLGGGVALGGSL